MKEIALGVNRKNLKPYNTMILCSSGSERRLLEQYLRIAGFKITGAEEKLISYFEEKVVDIPVKEKSESEVEEDEFSEEEMNLNEILLGFDKIDILFIEYKPYSNTLVLIQRIHQMYSKMIVFLIIDSIKKN